MATEVIMPVLGLTMETGTIVEWIKSEGDSVAEGEILFTVETDKSVMEVEAKAPGTLLKILNGPGEEVPIQQIIAYIGEPGESISDPTPVAAVETAEVPQAKPSPETARPAARQAGERVKSSPAARRYAREHGISIEEIAGSGPGGRIVRADVERVAASPTPQPVATAQMADGTAPATGKNEIDRSTLSGIRKITAARLSESSSTIPHFYLSMEIDMTKAVAIRRELNEFGESEGRTKVSVNDLVIRATALALKNNPAVNASLDGDAIVQYANVNVGFAVALDDGLVVPVVAYADRSSVYEIAGTTRALDTKAKSGGLSPADYGHGTFTISNLGMFGVDQFTAIINPPEAAILAVGRVKEVPVAKDGEISVGSVMTVTLSSDHRLIDGAVAARFLSSVRSYLEQPVGLLVQ